MDKNEIKNYVRKVLTTFREIIETHYPEHKDIKLYSGYPFYVEVYQSKDRDRAFAAVIRSSKEEKIKINPPLTEDDYEKKKREVKKSKIIDLFEIIPPLTEEKAKRYGIDKARSIGTIKTIETKTLKFLNEQKKLNEIRSEIDERIVKMIEKIAENISNITPQVKKEIEGIKGKMEEMENIKKEMENIKIKIEKNISREILNIPYNEKLLIERIDKLEKRIGDIEEGWLKRIIFFLAGSLVSIIIALIYLLWSASS